MLQININLKNVLFFAIGIAILYAISRTYKMQDNKIQAVKKLIPDKDVPFKLSANLQGQINTISQKQWEQINFLIAGGVAVANTPFAKSFAAVLSVNIPQTEHLKTNVISVLVLDSSGNGISHGFNINPVNQDVTVTFTEIETGTVLVS